MLAAGKSFLCPGVCDPPHHPCIVVSPAIPEGLMTNGSLSSKRISQCGYLELYPLLLSSILGPRERVCLGHLGGQAVPLGKATLHPPLGAALSHWPLADAGTA